MSDQNPYGNQPGGWQGGQQPPPQPPYGQPQPQQFGQPQFGQQFGQPQFGQPYGAPPPRKRTGLFVALGLLILVLVGGGITLALVLGGDDKDSSSQENEENTADPDVTLQGDGYSFGLPEGWSEVTDQIGEFTDNAPPDGFDLMAMIREGDRTGDNILVQKTDAEGETDPEALRDDWSESLLRTDIEERDPLDLDGAESIAVTSEGTTTGGHDVVYNGFLTIHDGLAYSILYTAGAGDEEHVEDVLSMVEASWTWE